MTRTVQLGAPSLTGKDANDLVAEVFADATYPLKVAIKNHMPHDVAFPEVEGLFLRHVANEKDSQKVVVIADADLFQRLASSVEQVAELNRYKLALTVSEVAAAAVTGTAGVDGADAIKKPSDGLTYDQMKAALTDKGITFPANAKKADLAALLDVAPVEPATNTDAPGATGIGSEGTSDAANA